ncbi:transposase [Corallococcus exiguus]|uniref:winged helix-turn-helix domain-containing protein n=1 Tax=Corallococcus exiguus TaxID=83462 RepID=UPI0014947E2A|nr:winged helix-turn-helix domain-containing protein [Corallococcus exiguus]NPC75441.1 transposase [Corallococcus exiguus]
MEAARLLESGRYTQAEVARELGVSPSTACEWARHLEDAGVAGLKSRARSGRPSKLTDGQGLEVKEAVKAGAKTAGFTSERWTLKRVAQFIRCRYGVHYHPNYLVEPLHRLGLSVQRPKPKARERDEALV